MSQGGISATQILIVNEDRDNGQLQQQILESCGYRVINCQDLESARMVLLTGSPHLMLLDQFTHSHPTGLEFYRSLETEGLSVPAILLTNSAEEMIIMEALRAGFLDFITKSHASLEYLPEMVGRALRNTRVERELAESEELHRVTLSSVSDTVLLTDELGQFTYVCPNVRVNFDYTAEEVQNLGSIQALLGRELIAYEELRQRGEVTNLEGEFPIRNGKVKSFLVSIKSVSIQKSRVLYSLRDVTEHRNLQLQRDRIFSQSLSLLGILGFDGTFKQLNPYWETVFGYPLKELMSRPFEDYIHPEDVQASRREMASLAAGGKTTAFEIRCRCQDGSYRWIFWNALPFLKEGHFYVSGHDITERKQAEASLLQAHEKFKALVNTVDGIVWEADARTMRFTFVSQSAQRMLGYPPELWVEDPNFWVQKIHPQDAKWVPEFCTKTTQEMRDHEMEYRMIAHDGKIVWLRDLVTVVGHEGKPVQIRGLMVNITAQRRAEERVAIQYAITQILSASDSVESAARELLEVLCRNFGCSLGELWLYEASYARFQRTECWGEIPEIVSRWLQAGHDIERTVGLGLAGLVKESGVPLWIPNLLQDARFLRHEAARTCGFQAAWALPIAQREEFLGVLQLFGSSGEEPHPEQISMLHSLCTQFAQFMVRKQAEKSLKLAEERYQQSQKMEAIGMLAGGIAHDFNNLLTVILGFAECMIEDSTPGEDVHEDATQIRNAAQRAAGLTRQLLAFSRRQVLTPVVLNLNDLVQEMDRLLGRVIGEHIELTVQLADDLFHVHADPAQIEQILMNLAINSRDAMPEGGQLRIRTENCSLAENDPARAPDVLPGKYVLLEVSDTGCGMDPETKNRAFEPFFTTKESGKGTGMGLATVYGIVTQSGGHIEFTSEVGRGATFRISLPAFGNETQEVSLKAAREPLPYGSETVLLVEDEAGVRTLVKRSLVEHGYQVLEAASGEDALRIAENSGVQIDLLLSDVVMPGISGKRLAEHLAVLRPGIPVIFMSGYTGDAIAQHGVLADCTAFLQKPFSQSVLIHKIREVLDQRGSGSTSEEAPSPDKV